MSGFEEMAPADMNRNKPVYLSPNTFNFTHSDSVTYQLPKDYHPEFLPPPVKITTAFGDYSVTLNLKNDNLQYIRRLVVNGGTYPPDQYKNWVDFTRKVKKNDQMTLSLIKKKTE